MAATSWLKYVYLAHFSKPRTERQLYRLAKVHKFCRIVEVGIQDIERTMALIAVAQRFASEGEVSYTGLDWFDARPDDVPSLTLKEAHRALKSTGATARLVPGDPARTITTIANAHQHTGLLLLTSVVPESMLAPAWFYLPRMIDADSVVLRERIDAANRSTFEMLPKSLLVKQATSLGERKAA